MSSAESTSTGSGIDPTSSDAPGLIARWWDGARPNSEPARTFSPGLINSTTAVLSALRWGAVMIGLAFAPSKAAEGEVEVVITLAVAIFITSWRTISPIRFGEPGPWPFLKAIGDVAALAVAIGISDGLTSPFAGSLFVAVAIVGFGWGLASGIFSGALSAVLAAVAGLLFGPQDFQFPEALAVTALAGVSIVPGVALARLAEIEQRRRVLAAQRDRLAETNQLLEVLTEIARTLPSSLDLNDVIQGTRQQLSEAFDTDRLAILSYEDGDWAPQYQAGFDVPPQVATADLPHPLPAAADAFEVIMVADLAAATPRTGSGLYARLVVGGVDIGLVAVEHNQIGYYEQTDAELLAGMADVLALTLANARSFRRLRSLAAAEERSRIARDLHDRLGQYLTYIALELERINSARDQPSADLKELHEDVQGAIGEFRDTLIELRAAVSAERPLSIVLAEVVERFQKRSHVQAKLTVPGAVERLPAVVENELLRIAQEALVNVEKHSSASEVHIAWTVAEGRGVLVVQDDGRGFDPSKGIRGSAYGLVGMRERAASVGAMLEVSSEPGQGTTITVQTS
ncbi:MAG: histidine kinase [Actinomycetota bacterium]